MKNKFVQEYKFRSQCRKKNEKQKWNIEFHFPKPQENGKENGNLNSVIQCHRKTENKNVSWNFLYENS